jgi:hypothetical protein
VVKWVVKWVNQRQEGGTTGERTGKPGASARTKNWSSSTATAIEGELNKPIGVFRREGEGGREVRKERNRVDEVGEVDRRAILRLALMKSDAVLRWNAAEVVTKPSRPLLSPVESEIDEFGEEAGGVRRV